MFRNIRARRGYYPFQQPITRFGNYYPFKKLETKDAHAEDASTKWLRVESYTEPFSTILAILKSAEKRLSNKARIVENGSI